MPIKPENAKRYPANWKQIRDEILERAGHRCEQCGVPNHNFVYRDSIGVWFITGFNDRLAMVWPALGSIVIAPAGAKITEILLTIAHLDHVPENVGEPGNRPNLRAWCQRCHLAYDHKHHQRNARATRKGRKAIGELFP